MILPGILLVIIFIGLLVSLKMEKGLPLIIGLIILGVLCGFWYIKSRPAPVTSIDMEVNRQQAIGYTLTREALERLSDGDEILVLTTEFPAWAEASKEMQKGLNIALGERKGITTRPLNITSLGEIGARVDPDLSAILKAVAPEVKGADAIITAFPGMGNWQTPIPKLPSTYVYYDGQNQAWQSLIRKKRLRGVAVPMIWREDPPGRELHPLEELFRQEYLYVNAENVSELSPVPAAPR